MLTLVAALSSTYGGSFKAPDNRCDPDNTSPNQCNYLAKASCQNNGVTYYCDSFGSPGTCTANAGATCYFQQNVPCGTQTQCSDNLPAKDGQGNNIACTGTPDRCTPTPP
jgi:hypothetical protein